MKENLDPQLVADLISLLETLGTVLVGYLVRWLQKRKAEKLGTELLKIKKQANDNRS